MGHEEREALPLVQELLSAEGWQKVEKAAESGKGLKDLVFLAPWIADGLTPEQLDTVVRMLGKPFKWLLAMTRGRYARRRGGGLPLRLSGLSPRPRRGRRR